MGRNFRRSGSCFRRNMRLCVNKCNSRVLGKAARITVCARKAGCTLDARGVRLLDGFVHRACCRTVHKGCVLFSMLNENVDQGSVASGDTATLFTRHVTILSPRRVRRCGTVVTHLGSRRTTSCGLGPLRARCFQKSCALRMHPNCAFSIHAMSAHAVHYRCNGKRGLGACFVSSKYAGVMARKGRCTGVFPT